MLEDPGVMPSSALYAAFHLAAIHVRHGRVLSLVARAVAVRASGDDIVGRVPTSLGLGKQVFRCALEASGKPCRKVPGRQFI